ncbi:MAG: hypothetical protein ABII06_16740, partial [Pseudomonadota bacterium]
MEIIMNGGVRPELIIPEKETVHITYKKSFFEKHGIFRWINDFKLGTAGYRDTMNLENFFATDAPFNAHTLMIMAEAMARIYNRRGYLSVHFGGEVRRFTGEILRLVSGIFAFHGITVHLHADRSTTPIWASSFGVFYNELDGGANITASHSQNFKQGFKPLDEKGMQLLGMADEIRDEVKKIGEEVSLGACTIGLKPGSTPEIKKDFHYIEAYTEYLRDIIPGEALDMIRKAQDEGMRVGVSTVGGSMHDNSLAIFGRLGIRAGSEGLIRYMHWEKRDDFHRVGEIDGENYGCDPTKPVIYRNIGIKEKLLDGTFDFGFIWDPDGDRFNMITAAESSMADQAEGMGLEVERTVQGGKCVVYFKPNQIYFLNAVVKLEMMAKSGELFEYDWVIGTTYPTSRSIGELADVFNKKYAREFAEQGTKIRVYHTPVGFKYFGEMVGEIESRLEQGKEVILNNALNEKVSLGTRPRILIMAEESGGATMGGTQWAFSRNRRRKSIALKEKDGMQIALMNLGTMAILFLEGKTFAELYMRKIEEYDIRYRFYER